LFSRGFLVRFFIQFVQEHQSNVRSNQGCGKRIFLSYGRGKATGFTVWIRDCLKDHGFDVWMDTQLHGGGQWQNDIAGS
jgi:hypothetical protein